MTFSTPPPRKPEEFRVTEIRFLGEQDGPPERLLKDQFVQFFRSDPHVVRAYLARIDFGEGTRASVALGLRAEAGSESRIGERIGAIFASIFRSEEHLDHIFLTDDQELQLSNVCNPFYATGKRTGWWRRLMGL